jgi:5-formyltetrahydrofolate cyclo-ligase
MEGADVTAWRRTQRAALIAARLDLSAAEHRRRSAEITEHLSASFAHLAGRLVAFYWPFRREFDPLPFVKRLLSEGAALALPVVVGRGCPLEFRRWEPGTPMALGVYDIPFPAGGAPVTPDAFLISLVGFDGACFRLGYGAGYYDLTLAAYECKPLAIGVGFELGRLATIYPQPYDVPMDFVVTEAGVGKREGKS